MPFVSVSNYTREAGVRSLERKIGGVCRAVAVQVRNLRLVPLSLSPSCVTRKKTAGKKMTSRNPACSYFLLSAGFTHDGLSERGTTG